MESLGLTRAVVVRRVQDVSSYSGQLPEVIQYFSVIRRKQMGGGGEASIYLAELAEGR